jgi:hypothetical protein
MRAAFESGFQTTFLLVAAVAFAGLAVTVLLVGRAPRVSEQQSGPEADRLAPDPRRKGDGMPAQLSGWLSALLHIAFLVAFPAFGLVTIALAGLVTYGLIARDERSA